MATRRTTRKDDEPVESTETTETTEGGPEQLGDLTDVAPLDAPGTAEEDRVAPAAASMEPPAELSPMQRTEELNADAPGDLFSAMSQRINHPVLLDDATGEMPDPATVFTPVTEYGTGLVSAVRLVEKVWHGPHAQPLIKLVLPAGASVSPGQAQGIIQRLRAQQDEQAKAASSTGDAVGDAEQAESKDA